ncbi:MAG: hypothetical protein Q7R49_05275 [Candidatus Daviesbacteria bacterium]|nr:hypothetical protein [Candidatus Daviesbacteria bacterium]
MKLLILIFIIILTRFALTTTPSFAIDMNVWLAWSERLYLFQPWGFYDKNIWTNYTPGYLFLLWIIGNIIHPLQINFFSPTYQIILKSFTDLFDIATSVLIFLTIQKHRGRRDATTGAFLYLANPAIIFNSSVWGQLDGLLTFFLVLAFYLLYEVKSIRYSLPIFILGFIVKPQALAEIPIFLFSLIHYPIKKILPGFVLATLVWLFFSLLFFPKDILFGLVKLTFQMLKDYPYTSLYAFNFWALIGWWRSDLQTLLGLSLQTWGLALYTIFITIILFPLKKLDHPKPFLNYFAVSLITFAFYIFLTRIHERYLLPFFAFFLLCAYLKRSVKFIFLYILMSFIHLYNLWYVYFSLNNSFYIFLTTISLFVFVIMLKDYYQAIYEKK